MIRITGAREGDPGVAHRIFHRLGARLRRRIRGGVAEDEADLGAVRRALAGAAGGHFFVGPDNGILMAALDAAIDQGADRTAALDLLAADALVTLALLAQRQKC